MPISADQWRATTGLNNVRRPRQVGITPCYMQQEPCGDNDKLSRHPEPDTTKDTTGGGARSKRSRIKKGSRRKDRSRRPERDKYQDDSTISIRAILWPSLLALCLAVIILSLNLTVCGANVNDIFITPGAAAGMYRFYNVLITQCAYATATERLVTTYILLSLGELHSEA